MSYDFRSLLHADFEDLTLDLVGKSLSLEFEAFASGPDGGIDGRHSKHGINIILQAKHYVNSGYSSLKTAMRKERSSIDKLNPDRYILATSCSLTPPRKAELGKIIGPGLERESDIFGQQQLNKLLRDHPDVERAHLKLWLSSTAVLDAVLNAASYAFTATTRLEIASKVKVYASNPSLAQAREILENQHVLIISGPPGVGKTTLAEILAFAHIGDGWELVAIRSLEDGFSQINDAKKQIFFFDDFLGTIALDRRALAATDSALAMFMNRVRRSPNARFILTTRAYILNEAKSASERLADDRVDISTYILDMEAYGRAIRARILYNHLLVGETPQPHIQALLNSNKIADIVDHKNYNPRIIEWMTDSTRLDRTGPDDYVSDFLSILSNPSKLWDTAFRDHISPACRHLLIMLFFLGDNQQQISSLRSSFQKFHSIMCAKYGVQQDPKDFEQALRQLEGGFLEITDRDVDFINPSLRDFLADYLADGEILEDAAAGILTGRSAQTIWAFARMKVLSPDRLQAIARQYLGILTRLETSPYWSLGANHTWNYEDIDNSSRLELLLEWWSTTGEKRFFDSALTIISAPPQGFSSWQDGINLFEILRTVEDEDYIRQCDQTSNMKDALERAIVKLMGGSMSSGDLESMSDFVVENEGLSQEITNAVNTAIKSEIENIEYVIDQMDSESDLSDHAETLKRIAHRAAVTDSDLDSALNRVEERIMQIDATTTSSPVRLNAGSARNEEFDDMALHSLFSGLRQHPD